MDRISLCATAAATALFASNSFAQDSLETVSTSERGSLLIYPDIRAAWEGGEVVSDTLITLTNDAPSEVRVQFYIVLGTNCVSYDNAFTLTADQPVQWQASSGRALNPVELNPILAPLWSIDPSVLNPLGGGDIEATLYVWATGITNQPIKWNHLLGTATQVDYLNQTASEYAASAFQVRTAGASGTDVPGAADIETGYGTLALDGESYSATPDSLLLNFQAPGDNLDSIYSSGPYAVEAAGMELVLQIPDFDLFYDAGYDRTVSLQIDIWNENEIKFEGTTNCFSCYSGLRLENYPEENSFPLAILGTDAGKARINAMQDDHCSDSEDHALLGVLHTDLVYRRPSPSGPGPVLGLDRLSTPLTGVGSQPATVRYPLENGGILPEELAGS